jgi:short-subunit dehydrogenase
MSGPGAWIVTGASRGLGRQLALQLAARGGNVIAFARDSQALRDLGDGSHGRIAPLALDLSQPQQVEIEMRNALRNVGELAGVINNAGIGCFKPFEEHSPQEFAEILQVNLHAPMLVCHAVLPKLLAQGRGHIVNVGSDLGRRPLANMAPYVASKHGLAGFSHSLLREVKDRGVRVSLIQPGIIDTGFGGHVEDSREDRGSLDPAALARMILHVIDAPPYMVVDELTVHPSGQSGF